MLESEKAAELVAEVLCKGGLLICDKAIVMHKSIDGLITYAFYRNTADGAEEMYNGISPEKAALYFTEWIGGFEAMGLAVKWFREHSNTAIEMEYRKKEEEKDNG
jgi:hypothetical protein